MVLSSGGILTGMLPGKPSDWCGGKAGGGSFNTSFCGDPERDGSVFGEWIGEDEVSDADDADPGRRGTWAGMRGEIWWVGLIRGEREMGNWAVSWIGAGVGLEAGEGAPLSCCRHSEEQ